MQVVVCPPKCVSLQFHLCLMDCILLSMGIILSMKCDKCVANVFVTVNSVYFSEQSRKLCWRQKFPVVILTQIILTRNNQNLHKPIFGFVEIFLSLQTIRTQASHICLPSIKTPLKILKTIKNRQGDPYCQSSIHVHLSAPKNNPYTFISMSTYLDQTTSIKADQYIKLKNHVY